MLQCFRQLLRPSLGLFVVFATCLFAGLTSDGANAQPPAKLAGQGTRFRESVTLQIDSKVAKSIATAQDFVAEKKWSQAIPILQQIIENNGDAIVPLETGRYVNAADFCHWLISRFPDDGLRLYRERVDEQVRMGFEEGQRELDEQALRRVVSIGLLSSFGDEALTLLGELSFERGRFAAARWYWEQLVPEPTAMTPMENAPKSPPSEHLTYPDPDLEPAVVRAKLVQCSLISGEFTRADREIAAFRRLHPDAQGELSGKVGNLLNLLEDQRKVASQWSFDRPSQQDIPTFAGDTNRSIESPTPADPLTVSWSVTLPSNPFVGSLPRPALAKTGPLSTFPIAADGVAYVCGPSSIHAFDIKTGKPFWPTDENSDGRIYQTNIVAPTGNDMVALQGVPYFSMTADRGRVYARLGPPILRRSKTQRGLFSEIVGLDVASREGELVFHVSSDVLDETPGGPELTSWCFEGAPIVADDRVYVSARRSVPEDEIHVVCFEATSGQLIWRRRICATLKNMPEQFNFIGHRVLTLGDGRLFLDTGSGAIASIDAESGKLRWVSTFEATIQDETPFEFSDPTRHGMTPCVYADGVVFAAPAETNFVMAYDAASGQLLWQQRFTDRVLHLLGVSRGKLIVSGRNLWALDANSGRFAWPEKSVGFKDPQSYGYGRGVLTASSIYWPLHDEILEVATDSGELLRRIALRQATGATAGNLLIADGRLLVAQPHHMLALGEVPNAPVSPTKILTRRSKVPATKASSDFVSIPTRLARMEQGNGQQKSKPSPDEVSPAAQSIASARHWPARELWSLELSAGAKAFLPMSHSMSSVTPLVLLQKQHEVRALNALDGQELWGCAALQPLLWTNHTTAGLVLADQHHIECRENSSGQPLWKVELPITAAIQECHGDDRDVIVVTDRQVCVIAADTGQVRSQFEPSRNDFAVTQARRTPTFPRRLLSNFIAPHSRQLMAFDSPLLREPLLIDRSKSVTLSRWPQWRQAIQGIWMPASTSRAEQLIMIGDDNLMSCWSADGKSQWKSTLRLTVAFQKPRLLVAQDRLVLIEDGLFARGVDPKTGEIQWSAPLGRQPLHDRNECIACLDQTLVAVAGDTLTSIDLSNGKTRWRRHIGDGTWSIRASGTDTICLRESTETKPVEITVCETETGDAVQSLRIPNLTGRPRWLSSTTAPVALLAGDNRVIAFCSY